MENTYQSPDKVAKREGLNSTNDLIGKYFTQNEVPATCSKGCLVKADKKCEHGHVSILTELKLV